MLKKPALTCVKRSCNYNFLTFGSNDKQKGSFLFLDFFRHFPLLAVPIDCKKIISLTRWLCQWGLLKHLEVIIYQSLLHTDALRPGFILMVVFTFQVVVLKRDNDGSTWNYMKILWRHRSAAHYTVYLNQWSLPL